jgi:hypothetical protein
MDKYLRARAEARAGQAAPERTAVGAASARAGLPLPHNPIGVREHLGDGRKISSVRGEPVEPRTEGKPYALSLSKGAG